MTKKQVYTAPEAETLVVQAEGMVCLSNPAYLVLFSEFGDDYKAGANLIEDAGYDL